MKGNRARKAEPEQKKFEFEPHRYLILQIPFV